jgi:4-amino-4-deoxy-L-arabinose transferase-like glycosyltransferase
MATSVDLAPGGAPEPAARDRADTPGRSFIDRHFWLLVGGLLLLAFLVRAAYVLHTTGFHVRHDDKSYDYLARTLAAGHGWGYSGSAYRPPGYPVFLAVVYLIIGIPHGSWTATRLVEALVLSTGTVALIGTMAWQVAGRRVALISLAIGAVYIPLVLVGVSLMTESLFVPLMLLAVNCALRSRTSRHRIRWVVAAGVVTGLASLTRGNGLVLGLALLPLVWGRPWRSWRAAAAPALLLLLMVLVITPWTIRNAETQHAFVPVTTELGPTLAGTYNRLSAKTRYIWHIRGFPVEYPSIARQKNLNGAQVDEKLTPAVLRYILHHPQALPEAMFWNTMRLLDLQGRRVSRMTAATDEEASARWADYGVVVFWIFGALALVGVAAGAARGTPWQLWVVPLILWLSIAPVTTGTPRFRAALDPFIIFVAALAVHQLAPRAVAAWHGRRGRRRHAAPALSA